VRIHRLEIEAFGPFAGVQAIDFDQLSAQGLFLLNGPTGAGKTSVLDAICFALYGSVPGARQEGKRLRSDHADAAAEPRVVCEFSARGRRFEVTRSPAWDRPSARGRKGFTTQQAKTLLRELVDGSWEEKSSRNDEAGAEITELLGMDREQFTRVVMLPQGDFAAFLRSKAGDRLALLQKLFGTARFEAIEQQLVRQAQEARSAVETEESGLRLLMQQAESAFDGLGTQQGETAGTEEEQSTLLPETKLADMESLARTETAERRRAAEAAGAARLQLADKLHAAQERSQRHTRLAAAVRRRDALAEGAAAVQEARERLRRHAKATVLRGQLDAVDRATSAHAAAVRRLEESTARLREASLDGGDAAAALSETQELLAVLEARVADEQRLQDIAARLAGLQEEQEAREAAAIVRADGLSRLREEATELSTRLGPLESEAAETARREQEAAAAAELVRTIGRYAQAVREASEASERHNTMRSRSLGFKQEWLDLRELRLRNAAEELAAKLEDGKPCPVCGSAEHPHPAEAALLALAIADEEEAARVRFEESEHELQRLAAALAAAEQDVAVLAGQGGDKDAAQAGDAVAAAGKALAAARAASVELREAKAGLERITAAVTVMEQEEVQAATASAQAGSTMAVLGEQQAELDATLAGLRAGFPSLRSRITALTGQRTLLEDAVAAALHLERTEETYTEARRALERALPDAGFESADAARRELLESREADRLEGLVRTAEGESARVAELFETEELVLAWKEAQVGELPLDAEGLAGLAQDVRLREESVRNLELAAGLASRTVDTLSTLRSRYLAAAAAIQAPREKARLLTGLAETARGAGENSYKMSLNSYVLAARLEQVALAASERLVAMSDGRYTLRHSDARAARGQKSGLGLEVVDEWTGQHRDTATLSGGESFMASLSLALGLADVVQQEAGGVDIETLFVDEGFGSLDEQALEQVMDALEGLRDGGRVVGLVSHVAEMKQRISSQLQVVKGRNGSSVRILEADIR
jgi:DNA repair protein SbcC/Rad50